MQSRTLHNIRLQYARWEDLPLVEQDRFTTWMGSDPREGALFYQYLYYWYNTPRQVGHLLRALYQNQMPDAWGEESIACQFASAYWKIKGETRRLLAFERMLLAAAAGLPDPSYQGRDREIYLGRHPAGPEQTQEASAYYQFHMMLASLRRPLDFPLALRTLVSPAASDGNTIPLSPAFEIDELLPYHTLEELGKTITAYGLRLPPVQIICAYTPGLTRITWEA